MPNTPRRVAAATKIQAAFRGMRVRRGGVEVDPWNRRWFGLAQPHGIDPVSLNNIPAGNVYFSIPTASPNVRTPLSRTTFVTYVHREYPHLQRGDIHPFAIAQWNPRAVLFTSPVTRRPVRVRNVRMHVKPLYQVKPLRSNMNTPKRKNNNNRPTQGQAKRRRVAA